MRTLNEYKPRAPYEFSETYTWTLSEYKPRAPYEVSVHGTIRLSVKAVDYSAVFGRRALRREAGRYSRKKTGFFYDL